MPIRIAVIGTGHMGKIHLGKLNAFEGVEVAAINDIDEAALSTLSGQYHIPFYTDYRKIPGKLDGVVISTPTDTHFAIAQWFLERNVHVFVEKPVTFTFAQGRKLVDYARDKALLFQVGHLERLNPAFKKAAGLITTPVVIEACRVSPFTGRSTDVDVVLDLMIHDLDLVLSLVKDEARRINARGISLMSDKLDAASVQLEFRSGCAAHLFASRVASRRERALTVFEKDRCFFIDFMQGKLSVSTRDKGGSFHTEEYVADHIDPVRDELMEFTEAIRGNGAPSVTGEDGLRALSLANKITKYIAKQQH